jgi:hypothetical protein
MRFKAIFAIGHQGDWFVGLCWVGLMTYGCLIGVVISLIC